MPNFECEIIISIVKKELSTFINMLNDFYLIFLGAKSITQRKPMYDFAES
jgi:hypothetical protein